LYFVDDEKNERHGVAEAEFAGEQVKKLAPDRAAITLALAGTVVPRLTKDVFMGNRPGNTGDRDGDEEKGNDL